MKTRTPIGLRRQRSSRRSTRKVAGGLPTMANNDSPTAGGASKSKRSELDRGQPGASVAREHRRRKSSREASCPRTCHCSERRQYAGTACSTAGRSPRGSTRADRCNRPRSTCSLVLLLPPSRLPDWTGGPYMSQVSCRRSGAGMGRLPRRRGICDGPEPTA